MVIDERCATLVASFAAGVAVWYAAGAYGTFRLQCARALRASPMSGRFVRAAWAAQRGRGTLIQPPSDLRAARPVPHISPPRHSLPRRAYAIGEYFASPVAADGKIYFASADGKVSVITATPKWEFLAVNDPRESISASPAIPDGAIFIRTHSRLYCFRKP